MLIDGCRLDDRLELGRGGANVEILLWDVKSDCGILLSKEVSARYVSTVEPEPKDCNMSD